MWENSMEAIDKTQPMPDGVSSIMLKFLPSMQKYMKFVKEHYAVIWTGEKWKWNTLATRGWDNKPFDWK